MLIVIRYPAFMGWLGLISMALFHIPLLWAKRIAFYKLLGTGRNGTFDLRPNWREWAIFLTTTTLPQHPYDSKALSHIKFWCGDIISSWCRLFKTTTRVTILECLSSKGSWDGRELFETAGLPNAGSTRLAVLTRATIRLRKLRSFWKNVPAVAESMAKAEGLEYSIGIGEAPVYRQATFSIWRTPEHMRMYAYKQQEHKAVISKTRTENWYAEEMFTRFGIVHECKG